MSGIKIENLTIKLGGTEILKNLNLQVDEGEFLVLLGPSGCGKSTLLHGIAGLLDEADLGDSRISIGGRDVTHADPSQRGIGMVFQSYALYPTMTVERNMSFGLRVSGLPKAEVAQRVERAAELLQLKPLLQRKPAMLSGGQRQRVAIGRALVREADVFLFDEPLSNLDAKLRTELRRELKTLHRQLGSTMVYVTHDQVEAMTLATRIVIMRAGVIQQIGAPNEVYERPENLFVAGFLGAPGMNLLQGQMRAPAVFVGAQGFELDWGAYALRQPVTEGQAVVLGIRPEHLRVSAQGAWTARVQLVEPMGAHQVVWLDFRGQTLALIAADPASYVLDSELRFDIDPSHLSLFDQASGLRL